MKRFITYLYECKKGSKTKNVGFVRVNVKGNETRMELCLRNCSQMNDNMSFYVLAYKEDMYGVCIGTFQIVNGKSDCRFDFQTDHIEESEIALDEVIGIGIRGESGLYIVSCWEDAYALEISQGEFTIVEQGKRTEGQPVFEEKTENFNDEPETQICVEVQETSKEIEDGSNITYEKIDLSQIRDLPSPNWHLATNSFLVHGFWNYGYLVLKKEMEENKETLSLGVPGVFEKPEAVMAALFGFPTFEEIEKEKNQEAKVGTFGCWFVNLKA